jgi:hypothetical protein|tara:strand:+ start:55 stop:447 length:393 start_codon:yes stop_codon:yes gene_type:complete
MNERIYHHYKLWEDHKCGFYNNCSGDGRKEKIQKAVEMFNSERLTREYMDRVIREWKYSCEHNFTNSSLNKIAYIGQAACCLYGEVPNTVTMEAWNMLDRKVQNRSNMIAEEVLSNWIGQNGIQICLNID